MTRWQDVQEHARKRYTLIEDREEFFSVLKRFDNGRSQKVFVEHVTAYGRGWLRFTTWVCDADEMPADEALERNTTLVVGALSCDSDGDFVLRHTVPLGSWDVDELGSTLTYMAACADDLEDEYTGEDRF